MTAALWLQDRLDRRHRLGERCVWYVAKKLPQVMTRMRPWKREAVRHVYLIDGRERHEELDARPFGPALDRPQVLHATPHGERDILCAAVLLFPKRFESRAQALPERLHEGQERYHAASLDICWYAV
jgi:hypothetical protein